MSCESNPDDLKLLTTENSTPELLDDTAAGEPPETGQSIGWVGKLIGRILLPGGYGVMLKHRSIGDGQCKK